MRADELQVGDEIVSAGGRYNITVTGTVKPDPIYPAQIIVPVVVENNPEWKTLSFTKNQDFYRNCKLTRNGRVILNPNPDRLKAS